MTPEQREDLIDTLWQAISDRVDVDVGPWQLAHAAVDALPAKYTAGPDMLEALEMIRDADDDCIKDGLPRPLTDAARAKVDRAINKATGAP